MIGTLIESLTAAASDDSLRAVHIRGAGDDFCAGSDWVAANDPGGQRPRTGDLVRRVPHAAHRVIELVAGIQLPVVCSVRGWAVGFGCNLALAADFTVAAGDAFNAGLGVALAEGQPIGEAVRWGAAAGALATTKPGATSAMPYRAELLALLER